MVGWTILLFRADRKPVERKDVLLLTVPVVVGFYVYWIYTITTGAVAPLIPVFIVHASLIFIFM